MLLSSEQKEMSKVEPHVDSQSFWMEMIITPFVHNPLAKLCHVVKLDANGMGRYKLLLGKRTNNLDNHVISHNVFHVWQENYPQAIQWGKLPLSNHD